MIPFSGPCHRGLCRGGVRSRLNWRVRTTMRAGGGGLDGVYDIDHLVIATLDAGAVGRHRMMVAVRVDIWEGGENLTRDPFCRGRGCLSLDGSWSGRGSGRRRWSF